MSNKINKINKQKKQLKKNKKIMDRLIKELINKIKILRVISKKKPIL